MSDLLRRLSTSRFIALLELLAVALLLVAWALNFALRDPVDTSVTLSGVRVFPLDVLAAVLAAIAVIRALLQWRWDLGRVLAFAVLALVAIYILRGFVAFDLETGANAARSWFWFSAALAFAVTSSAGEARSYLKLVIVTGFALAVAAVPHFIADGIHSSSYVIEQDGDRVNWRPVIAPGAVIILQGAILAVAMRWPSPRLGTGFAAFALVVVVLLQHRTLWIAAAAVVLVAVAYWLLTSGTSARRRLAIGTAVAAVVVAVPAAVLASGKADALVDSATSGDTTSWRTRGWEQLVQNNDSPSRIAFGNPAGQGFERLDRGKELSVTAHNEYLDAYVRFGLPGALVVIALLVVIVARRREAGERAGISPLWVSLLLLSVVIFTMSNELNVVHGFVLGALIAPSQRQARGENET